MSKRDRKKHLRAVKRKKELKERSVRQASTIVAPPREIRNVLLLSYQLMDDREYAQAEELLEKEHRRRPSSPEVLEALVDLYQRTGDHMALARVTPALVRLQPQDPRAFLIMAQSFLMCGRAAIAVQTYRSFLEKWPTHNLASKATAAIQTIEPELLHDLASYELSESEMPLLVMHDQMCLKMANHEFEGAVQTGRELLAIQPRLVPARNNLAISLFQINHMSESLQIARKTVQLFPENKFAEALLGRTLFLLGEFDKASEIADHIVTSFAVQQDALAVQAELLSFLGRDNDIIDLVRASDDVVDIIPQSRGVLYHYKAVALMRLGQVQEAYAAWKRCLKEYPNCRAARQNLEELASPSDGHTAWANAMAEWIPIRVTHDITEMIKKVTDNDSPVTEILRRWPHLARLVPGLLDRGDHDARNFAMMLAKADGSASMLNAVKDFAMGQRGPDSMRMSAILFLRGKNVLGDGPVRFCSKGVWTEVVPYSSEISYEPEPHADPGVTELLNVGIEALNNQDLQSAETKFRQCIKIDPDCPSAWNNLAATLCSSTSKKAHQEAEQILHDLMQRFPDYPFSRIALAQIAIHDGQLNQAQELLAPLASRSRWHVSEALAHCTAMINLYIAKENYSAAEATLELMRQIDPEDYRVEKLQDRIQLRTTPSAFWGDKLKSMMKRVI